MRPIVGVGAVAVTSDHKIVLVRRRFEPLAGEWSLPGGALEVGETLQQGVAREVLEETGLVVDVGPVVEAFDRVTRDADGRVEYHYVLIDFLCHVRGGILAPGTDALEAVYADPDALDPYGLTEVARRVVRRALTLR